MDDLRRLPRFEHSLSYLYVEHARIEQHEKSIAINDAVALTPVPAASLARTLKEHRDEALLFRELATLRTDAPIPQHDPDELRWRGADRPAFEAIAARLRSPRLLERLPARE